ncbi:MAG: outer membrane beta-barrel protein, partial [Bacteroidia bacterium]
TSTIRYTNENYIDSKKIGISENFIFDKLGWWTSTNEMDLNYSAATSNLIFITVLKGFNSTASTNNDFNLNKNKTILFNANYTYVFQSVSGIFNYLPHSSFSLALQVLLLDKNLKISLRASDIFRTERERYSSTVNGIQQTGNNYYDNQAINLSVSYKFGNKILKVNQRQTGNEEEQKRTGG